MKRQTIAIAGLGLMGGSLAAAVRRKFPHWHVVGITRNRTALREALRKKWIHESFRNLEAGVSKADFIVLCTPVDTLIDYLSRLDRSAKPGAVVTDVGSVKGEIMRRIRRKKFRRIRFVSAHPMAGSHAQGIGAARQTLYDGSYVFLIRRPGENQNAIRIVKDFWKKICERVIEIGPEAHDRIVGEISHLPHAVSACLVASVGEHSIGFASSGFSDATRIAQSHPSVWVPIFSQNRRELVRALGNFEQKIKDFKKALRRNDTGALKTMIIRAARKRAQISF